MGDLHVGYNNLTISATTIGARTEDAAYPVSGLQQHTMFPGYRSADRCLILNGTNEYAYVADAAGISITGDLTIEALIYPTSVAAGTVAIIDKLGANDGWGLYRTADELVFYVRGATNGTSTTNAVDMVANTWYRVKVVYDASAQEVTWYINGASAAATAGGTIPSAISDNAVRITIGADSAGANFFAGRISYIGIDAAEFDNYGYLNPSGCNAYWDFDDDDLTDGVGGFTLTGSGIDSTNYTDCTAYHWIDLVTSSDDPAYLFIPRQHNLSTGATVKFWRGDKFGGTWSQVGDTCTVTAGVAVVIRDATPPGATTTHYVEIHDPSNADGYLSIPYLYIGDVQTLTADFAGAGTPLTPYRPVIENVNPLGNKRTYNIGSVIYAFSGTLTPISGNLTSTTDDFAYLLAIQLEASQGKPLVWCIDNSSTALENKYTVLCYWNNAAEATFEPLTSADQWQMAISLQEMAVEA